MAVTNQNSDLMANVVLSPPAFNAPSKSKGRLVCEAFSFTQVGIGDINSTIRICQLPQKARLLADLCFFRFSAFGAARLLSFGYEAYSKPDGSVVAASMTALGSALDVATASRGTLAATPTAPTNDTEFEGSPVIVAQCTGGTIPDGATFKGIMVYSLP
jgi:hypothetical protein